MQIQELCKNVHCDQIYFLNLIVVVEGFYKITFVESLGCVI